MISYRALLFSLFILLTHALAGCDTADIDGREAIFSGERIPLVQINWLDPLEGNVIQGDPFERGYARWSRRKPGLLVRITGADIALTPGSTVSPASFELRFILHYGQGGFESYHETFRDTLSFNGTVDVSGYLLRFEDDTGLVFGGKIGFTGGVPTLVELRSFSPAIFDLHSLDGLYHASALRFAPGEVPFATFEPGPSTAGSSPQHLPLHGLWDRESIPPTETWRTVPIHLTQESHGSVYIIDGEIILQDDQYTITMTRSANPTGSAATWSCSAEGTYVYWNGLIHFDRESNFDSIGVLRGEHLHVHSLLLQDLWSCIYSYLFPYYSPGLSFGLG